MRNYLIVGNGAAGAAAAEAIRKTDAAGNITMLTEEDLPYYSRIRLPEYMADEISEESLIIKKKEWYSNLKIHLELNTSIMKADADAKSLTAENGRTFDYDRLLLACGSRSFLPPIPGLEKQGVFCVRNVRDVREIAAYAKDVENVVLIGGGLLGLECGNALRKLGKKIRVVEFFPRLLPRQLDLEGAEILLSAMKVMGFEFRLGGKTQELVGHQKVEGVLLEGGELLPAGMVLISAGVRPELSLAKSLNLDIDKGIKVDDFLRTSRLDIYAAGDVAEYGGMVYGIWPAATEQGKTAGINMAGGSARYTGTTMLNKLKVVGIDVASAGDIDVENQKESKIYRNEGQYRKIVFDGNKIVGCIMLGDTRPFNRIVQLITEETDISAVKENLFS